MNSLFQRTALRTAGSSVPLWCPLWWEVEPPYQGPAIPLLKGRQGVKRPWGPFPHPHMPQFLRGE